MVSESKSAWGVQLTGPTIPNHMDKNKNSTQIIVFRKGWTILEQFFPLGRKMFLFVLYLDSLTD